MLLRTNGREREREQEVVLFSNLQTPCDMKTLVLLLRTKHVTDEKSQASTLTLSHKFIEMNISVHINSAGYSPDYMITLNSIT